MPLARERTLPNFSRSRAWAEEGTLRRVRSAYRGTLTLVWGAMWDACRRPSNYRCDNNGLRQGGGGWGGIRTHGGLAPTAVFKTAALNRSATHPACPHPNCRLFIKGFVALEF